MDFKELIAHYRIQNVSEDGVAYWDVTPEDCNKQNAPVIGVHSILFVIDGELTIRVQGKIQLLTRGCLADVIDHKENLKLLAASPDIRAILLLLTEEYLSKLFKHTPPFPILYVMDRQQHPVFTINDGYISLIIRCLQDIKQTLIGQSHLFRKELLSYRTLILFMEMSNIFSQEKENAGLPPDADRKKMLFAQFVKLLPQYIKKEHTVNFYATLLCITPQYLRRVVKECSEKTVSEWINEELIREIRKMLQETDMSVQEIAEKLNFSEQAVLTKLFKRYMGVTPLKYRNQDK